MRMALPLKIEGSGSQPRNEARHNALVALVVDYGLCCEYVLRRFPLDQYTDNKEGVMMNGSKSLGFPTCPFLRCVFFFRILGLTQSDQRAIRAYCPMMSRPRSCK